LRATLQATEDVDILTYRKVATSWGSAKHRALATGRSHPKLRARSLLNQAGGSAPEELVTAVTTSLEEFAAASGSLEGCVATLMAVILSTLQDRTTELLERVQELESRFDSLATSVEDLATWWAEAATSKASERKKATWRMGKAMAPFQSGGVPTVLRQFMLQRGLVPRPATGAASDWPVAQDTSLPDAQVNPTDRQENWATPLLWSLGGLPEKRQPLMALVSEWIWISTSRPFM